MTLSPPKSAFKHLSKLLKKIKFIFVQLIIFLTKVTAAPSEIMHVCQAASIIIIHCIIHMSEQLTFSYPDAKQKKIE